MFFLVNLGSRWEGVWTQMGPGYAFMRVGQCGMGSCPGLCGIQLTGKGESSWLNSCFCWSLSQENSCWFLQSPQMLLGVGSVRAVVQMRNQRLRNLKSFFKICVCPVKLALLWNPRIRTWDSPRKAHRREMKLMSLKQGSWYWSSDVHVLRNHGKTCEPCRFQAPPEKIPGVVRMEWFWCKIYGFDARFMVLHNFDARFMVWGENE